MAGLVACNGSNTTTQGLSGPNVMDIYVGGQTLCGQNGYINEPCTSVTICQPGTTNCQTISNILVDTGSFGLRIFSSVITVPLTQVTNGTYPVAECAQFGTGDEWGPVQMASVVLGGEPAVTVPIQVINSSYESYSGTGCSGVGTSPATSGFNGILGVGLFPQDCGTGCTTVASNGYYFYCNGSNCTNGTTVSLSNQVTNPVAMLPVDNNGVLVQLPGVALGGVASLSGYLILGIGTQSDNSPSGAVKYSASNSANFTTVFNGTTATDSFIDSGSNGLFFAGGPTQCSGSSYAPGFYCPASTTGYTVTTKGYTGSPSVSVAFNVGNASNLVQTGNSAFSELAGVSSSYFDLGLPFFYGRSVFVGIEGKTSSLGTGPYWAY